MKAWLAGVAQFNADHRAGLTVGFSTFIIASAIGASRVVVDSNSLNDFWKDAPIRQATVRVDDEMGGVTNIVYLFDGGGEDAIRDPALRRFGRR